MDRPSEPAQPPSAILIDKVIHFQNFHTKAVTEHKIKVEYVPSARSINLTKLMQKLHSDGMKIENSQIFYQNVDMKMYMYLGTFPFEENIVYLKYQYCAENIVRLRYKKINDSPKQTVEKTKMTQNPATAPNKQRTIEEVFKIVKQWRSISAQTDEFGKKKHTFVSAAEVVGINKKTLDDYSLQIQYACDFNFDFEKYKNQKIGVLRKFVKEKKREMKKLNDTDKYWGSYESSGSQQRDN